MADMPGDWKPRRAKGAPPRLLLRHQAPRLGKIGTGGVRCACSSPCSCRCCPFSRKTTGSFRPVRWRYEPGDGGRGAIYQNKHIRVTSSFRIEGFDPKGAYVSTRAYFFRSAKDRDVTIRVSVRDLVEKRPPAPEAEAAIATLRQKK